MIRPPINTALLTRLFVQHWHRTRDLEDCVELVAEAALLGATKAVLRRRQLARAVNHEWQSAEKVVVLHDRSRKLKTGAPLLKRYAVAAGVPVADLTGSNKSASVCGHRSRAAWLLREASRPRLSFSEIGLLLGGRDHSTIMSAHRRVEAEIAARPELRGELLALVGVGGVDVAAADRSAA